MRNWITNEAGEPIGYEDIYPEDQDYSIDDPFGGEGPNIEECPSCHKRISLEDCDIDENNMLICYLCHKPIQPV